MRYLPIVLIAVAPVSSLAAADTPAVRAARAIDAAADPTGAATAWRAALPGLAGVERGRALLNLGKALAAASQSAQALAALDEAAPLLSARPATPTDRAQLLSARAAALADLNRLDEADAAIDQALGAWHVVAPAGSADEADAHMIKATIAFSRGNLDAAKAAGARSIAMFDALGGDSASRIGALGNMSTIHLQARELEASEQEARAAMTMVGRSLPEDHPVAIVALTNWVAVLAAQGRRQEAVPVLARIAMLRERKFGPDYAPLAITYNNLSRNLFFLDQSAQAEPYARKAVAIGVKTRAADDQSLAAFRDNLADILEENGKRVEAIALRREALTGLGAKGNEGRIVRIRRSLGISLVAAGDNAGALTEFRAVMAWADKTRPPNNPDRLDAAAQLAVIESRLGAPEAKERMRATLDLVQRELFAGADATRRQTNLPSLLEHLLETAWRTGDRAAGFRVAQLLLQNETGRAVGAVVARRAAGSGEAAALLRHRQDLMGERERQSSAALRAFGKNNADFAVSTATVARIDGELSASGRALETAMPHYVQLTRFAPLAEGEVQARLHADQALVMPVPMGGSAITFVVRRNRVDWARSPSELDLRSTITAMRLTLGGSGEGRGAAADSTVGTFDTTRAHDLYRGLVPRALDPALAGATTWLLAPAGAFTAVPFAALVTDRPVGGGRPTAWLIRKVALATLPGIGDINRETTPGARGGRFVGIGAPALGGDARPRGLRGLYREGAVDRAALLRLAPLPQAGKELERMSLALPGAERTLLTGAAATETAVKHLSLRRIGVLAFATHGLVGGSIEPGSEPGLVLTPPPAASAEDDGILSASEIAALDLDAEWVVLSACDTAAGSTPGAPALSGLASAFIYAGARSLLVSHWAVRDDVAARLTVDTVRRAAKGESRPQALRHAMLALLADARVIDGQDPAVWAPFALVEP